MEVSELDGNVSLLDLFVSSLVCTHMLSTFKFDAILFISFSTEIFKLLSMDLMNWYNYLSLMKFKPKDLRLEICCCL